MEYSVMTTAVKTEGGSTKTDWWEWATRGNIVDDTDPFVACEHALRWDSDALLVKNLNVKRYVMSLEWAKAEPREGIFDPVAIDRYRTEIERYRELGIAVTVVLFAYALPSWLSRSGGFLRPDAPKLFGDYAEFVAKAIGGLADGFITVFEPNLTAHRAYVHGMWPPGKAKRRSARIALSTLCAAHIEGYKRIKAVDENIRVGASAYLTVLRPKHASSAADVLARNSADRLYQRAVVYALTRGAFVPPLKKPKGVKRGCYCDFFAASYYTRTMISGSELSVKNETPVSDNGAEIYPHGAKKVLKSVRRYYGGEMWLVSGVADKADAFRARYISETAAYALSGGAEVFVYGTLMDCFELCDGITQKYGLYETDFGSQERTLRRSGEYYKRLCAGEDEQKLYDEYVKGQEYPVS